MPDHDSAASFVEYASLPDLSVDAVNTIELLIEKVRSEFDPTYWGNWSERDNARSIVGYQPKFAQRDVGPAAKELQELTWLSFQNWQKADLPMPLRDIRAFRFMPKLTGLVLTNNEIADLQPLSDLSELQRLHLDGNPVRDLSPLASCVKLEELHLSNMPLEDLSVLGSLPNLVELHLGSDLLPAFRRSKTLPALRYLELSGDAFDCFEGFPDMPALRVIRGATVASLRGLEQFPSLECLLNFSGAFSSLAPLCGLDQLTHLHMYRVQVDDLTPLKRLNTLRDLTLSTERKILDLAPLIELPQLHEVSVSCAEEDAPGLKSLRRKLPSWDTEFRAAIPRHTPSLALEIVDQETFDHYDGKERFNRHDADNHYGLLSGERNWVEQQLMAVLQKGLDDEEDIEIPHSWANGRSLTVCIYSEKAVRTFARLVLGMQAALAQCREDWIIFFHTDDAEPEFIVWVYPNRIMVTEKYADTVRQLIEQKGGLLSGWMNRLVPWRRSL